MIFSSKCHIIKTMRRHLIWILEVFVWLLILCSISGAFLFHNYTENKARTYQIFLPDVDGIIKGSPVKYMGIQIGYINQVNIVDDKVYMTFIVTDRNVRLPKGVIATVEFYGLGGSKSLEIYPPEKPADKTTNLIVVEPPKRIGDSLSLLDEMFGQIAEITYSISNFMDKVDIIKPSAESENHRFADNVLRTSNEWFDNSQKRLDNLDKKLRIGGANGRYRYNVED